MLQVLAIIHHSCICADDGMPRCKCGDVPQQNSISNTKNAGRSFLACATFNLFLWVDAKITMTPVRAPANWNKRKAS